MRADSGVDLAPPVTRAGVGELPWIWSSSSVAVGDHHERPVAGHAAQHLLGEQQHRQALAASPGCARRRRAGPGSRRICCDAPRSARLTPRTGGSCATILISPPGRSSKSDEVLDQVEQARRLAGAADRRLQARRRPARPRRRSASSRRSAPTARGRCRPCVSRAVREDDEPVGPEQLRDRVAVVGEVLVVGVLDGACASALSSTKHQRDAVDEAARGRRAAGTARRRPRPARRGRSRCSSASRQSITRTVTSSASPRSSRALDLHAVPEQAVDLPVGARLGSSAERSRVSSSMAASMRVRRQAGVEPLSAGAQAASEDDLVRRSRARACRAGPSISSKALTTSQPSSAKSCDRRLLDQRVLGEARPYAPSAALISRPPPRPAPPTRPRRRSRRRPAWEEADRGGAEVLISAPEVRCKRTSGPMQLEPFGQVVLGGRRRPAWLQDHAFDTLMRGRVPSAMLLNRPPNLVSLKSAV